MRKKIYAIIDVETTGGRAGRDRITEIAIVRYDGEKVIDRWSTLVNPERYIPAGITELTGITQEMVADAPTFIEIAKEVVERTEGAIFVAHNARFDYSFIQEEFKRLNVGYTYVRKQLCTVRLSRQVFPGLRSYSLGRLCEHFSIPNEARHRALGDADATTILLDKILNQKESAESADDLINLGIKESLLPANLSLEKIHSLPEACGVYYFYNIKQEVIYIGKSINIKKRVAEHFAKKTDKAKRLQTQVHEVSCELTGSELIALLKESFEIKQMRPKINRAQKIRFFPYIVHTWINTKGYRCFGALRVNAKDKKKLNIVAEYPKLRSAKAAIERIRTEFQLCGHYCTQHYEEKACFQFHLNQCYGACINQESPEDYNIRAEEAIHHLNTVFAEDFIILDEGRNPDEYALILVKDGNYRGYGYIDKEEMVNNPRDLEDSIQVFPGNPETRKIVQRFLSKQGKFKVLKF